MDMDQLAAGGRSRTLFYKNSDNRKSTALVRDAKDYYKKYEDKGANRESQKIYFNDNLVGECYIGFAKLLQSELR